MAMQEFSKLQSRSLLPEQTKVLLLDTYYVTLEFKDTTRGQQAVERAMENALVSLGVSSIYYDRSILTIAYLDYKEDSGCSWEASKISAFVLRVSNSSLPNKTSTTGEGYYMLTYT